MPIEDVFSIAGRGTVVTGRVERGIVKVGEEVGNRWYQKIPPRPPVPALKCSANCWTKVAGENVGALLRGVKREDVESVVRYCLPGTIKPHTKFESEVYVLCPRKKVVVTPFFKGYRPQFYFRTTDVTGTIELPEGVEMVMPGDNIKMVVTLIARSRWTTACVSPSVKVAVPWCWCCSQSYRLILACLIK